MCLFVGRDGENKSRRDLLALVPLVQHPINIGYGVVDPAHAPVSIHELVREKHMVAASRAEHEKKSALPDAPKQKFLLTPSVGGYFHRR